MVNRIGNILSKPIHFNFAVSHAVAVRILDHRPEAALQRRINTYESFLNASKADSVNISVWTSSQKVPVHGIILVVSRFVNAWETKASSLALRRPVFSYCTPSHECPHGLIHLLHGKIYLCFALYAIHGWLSLQASCFWCFCILSCIIFDVHWFICL